MEGMEGKPLRRLELLNIRLQAGGNSRYAKVADRWPGKGGIEEAPATRFDDHLGARKPLFGFAARSAFSTRMASSTKSRS